MSTPRPIRLTTVASNPSRTEPQEYAVIGGLPTATATKAGGIKRASATPNSTATDVPGVVADLNALLAKLRTAGVIAS
ncbi:MAG: Head fiber protein [Microbacterium sp.]|nr:Head fiber protein [Microbacterium sp.]